MRRINNEDAKTQRHEDETEETMITATFTLTAEVAMKLRVTQQVLDLIEEGKLQAINIGGGGRNLWRIPVEAYKAFLNANHSFRL